MTLVAPQDFSFYADESGISEDRYTVVGGLSMRQHTAIEAYASISRYRLEHGMAAEMKWSKVSNQKLAEYIAFVDLFFALNNTNRIHFHAVIFDSHQANHAKYNDGDPDVGLSKLYYDLLLHKFVKTCGKSGTLFACLDRRNSSTPLEEIRGMLNSAASRDHQVPYGQLGQLISRDSKSDCLLQMNDVILGAVCSIRNGRHLLSGTREAKRTLALYVLEKSGLETFDRDTPREIKRFTIWNKKPKQR